MSTSFCSKLQFLLSVFCCVLVGFGVAQAEQPQPDTSLVERIGTSRAKGPVAAVDADTSQDLSTVYGVSSAARTYLLPDGTPVNVVVANTPSESAAYALLTRTRNSLRSKGVEPELSEIGGASYESPDAVSFARGRTFVLIRTNGKRVDRSMLIAFAKSLSDTLPTAEGDVPVLVKHLPDWENKLRQTTYFVSLDSLRSFLHSPVVDGINFEGTEAVVADYDSSKLAVIEFPTPQLATENDQKITAKLQELRTQGEAVPSYRRVGNYGVLVFNPASEQAANGLMDQIKYEQITKWLGESPYPLLQAQRDYRDRTLGVLVSVVKASGIALLTCLTVGGIFGALLFVRRRAQQKAQEAYSDAGGMLRLNLDEMTPENDPARLLGR